MTLKTPKVSTAGRIFGVALLVGGVIGVILAIVGIIAGPMVVSQVGATANNMLSLTVDGLNAAKVTLEQAKTGIEQVQTGLDVVETTIVDAGNTVSESDEMLTGILRTVSQDVPDTIDSVQAAVPPAAETAKSILVDVEAAMVDAGNLVEQNGPLVNGAFRTISQDLPDTIDYWSAAIPPTAEAAHSFLATLEPAIVNTGETLKQADAMWQQGVGIVSNDVPNTIDYWSAAIPPNVELAKAYLDSAEASLDNASVMASQADATLDQAVKVASHDVPDAIDFWRTAIPPNAALMKAYVDATEARLADAGATAAQADAALDQAVQIASQQVPDTIDAWSAVIPPNAEIAKAYVDAAEANLVNAGTMAAQADAALDQAVQIASQQVPDNIDAWNAVIPPNADIAKAYVDAAEANLVNAGTMAAQADAVLDQAVQIASQQVPDTIDAWNAVIPPNVEMAKAYVNAAEANLANAAAMAAQTDAALDQAVQIASQQVPDTIDAWNAVIPPNVEMAKAYVNAAEANLANAGAMAAQADALLDQAVVLASQQVPDTIDAWNAVIPANAELVNAYVLAAETRLADASATAAQADAFLDQAVQIASQDVPDSIDAWNAVIPANAELAKAYVTSAEANLANAGALAGQTNAVLDQAVKVVGQQVPDAIDAWTAVIPPNAEMAQAYVSSAEAALANASAMAGQADAALNQAVQIASEDVPDTIDAWNAVIPPNAELAKAYVNAAEANLANAGATAAQADVVLDQAVKIVSQDVPQTIDSLNGAVPATAQAAQAVLDNFQNTMDWASLGVDGTRGALDATTQIVPATLDQVNAYIPSITVATETNINDTLALLRQLQYLDTKYRVELSTEELTANLNYLAALVRALDGVLAGNLDLFDQDLATLSYNAELLDQQIDQYVAVADQIKQISQQLSGLETVYRNSVDLEAVGQYALALSQNMAAINAQIDQLAAMSGQLALVSQQLRGLDDIYDANVDLEGLSQYLMIMSQNAAAINAQIDQLVAMTGQLELISQQLRDLEMVYNNSLDLGALSEDLLVLSESAAALRPQIDQLAALSSQQLDLVSQQLRGLESAYNASIDLGALSQDLQAMSQAAAAVTPQVDQLAALSSQQLDLMSEQLRAIEPAYEASLDMGALSQDLMTLSEGAAAVNPQIDQLAALSSQQLDLISEQLRAIEPAYDASLDLGALSRDLQALSQAAAAVNPQIDQLAALSSQQLDLISEQLRAIEPAYEASVDLGALGQNLMALSESAAAVNPQIDQLAALSSQQLDLVSQQLRGIGPAYEQSLDLGALSQQLLALSAAAAAVNPQIDQLAALSSQQLDQVSQQLRGLEPLYDASLDLGALSQDLMVLSQSAAALNPQIDQLAALSDQQLELVSQQLRAIEPVYNANLDLEAASLYLAALSQNVAAINSQLDQAAALQDQLDLASAQLRALEAYSDVGLGAMGDNVLAMTAYVDVADQQIDQAVAAAGQLDQWSSALRTLEPYANIDYGAIRGQILDLSGTLPVVRNEIDNLVALSGQLEQVSGALRTLAPLAETDFKVIGQDISAVSTNVSAVSAQLDQFSAMADQLIAQVDNTIASINQIQATLDSRLSLVKLVIVIFMIWIVLVMLAPLYLGWVLVSGRFHFMVVEA